MSNFDIDIHCNHLHCRKDIGQQKACVTSCSRKVFNFICRRLLAPLCIDIFCVDCANERFSEAKVCPACGASLTQKNDIVLIQLSPSEEYKSVSDEQKAILCMLIDLL
ncbi:hypothetical protein [Absidia glauca]|uniref:RING-type domain-containing protein n=1 Tax=Absidia glauca TaxID=4829 RepID=A0A168R6H0_ABSGL|nr:hypothetical protein [Absidia glauca]